MAYDGLVALDVGDANSFTAVAAGSIAPGDLVYPISGAYTYDSVGSRLSTYDWRQICVDAGSNVAAMAQLCVGVALTNATSGNQVAVLKRGIVVLPTGSGANVAGKSAVPAGYGVGSNFWNDCCVVNLTAGAGSVFPIGKFLTSGTAEGKFAIISLNI